MSSKADEFKAYKRLLKLFPGEYIQLNCSYNNHSLKGSYNAYCSGAGGISTIAVSQNTADKAVDRLIQLRREKEELRCS